MEETWGEKRRFSCTGTCLGKKCGDNKFISELIALFGSTDRSSLCFRSIDFLAVEITLLGIGLVFE
jgi:hypothetical protein